VERRSVERGRGPPRVNTPVASGEQAEYEEKLGHAMVKGHLITDNQLRTALDYQRSVGGYLGDVLIKLGFLQEPALKEFLARENLSGPPPAPAPVPEEGVPAHSAPVKKRGRKDHPPDPNSGVTEADPNRPRWGLNELAHLALSPPDPIIRALVRLLVKKGVISPEEEEEILLAAGTPSAT